MSGDQNSTAEMPDRDLKATSAEIAAHLRLLHPEPGTLFEVRVLGVPHDGAENGTTVRAWYRHEDIDSAAMDIAEFDATREPRGIYCTINPCKPELLVRGTQLLKGSATGDDEIAARHMLIIDCDPNRAEGHKKDSATAEEKEAARRLAIAVRDYLASQGWPAPLMLDSGNGWYLFYRIDLENDLNGKEIVKKCLVALGQRFDTDGARVDRGMYNASRIARVAGTLNRKGAGTTERPHRFAALPAEAPRSLIALSTELLVNLAREIQPETKTIPPKSTTRSSGETLGATSDTLLDLIKADGFMLTPRSSNKGEGPCPWCQGDDRFFVAEGSTVGRDGTKDFFHCRQCGRSGDSVEWLIQYRKMDILEAKAARGVPTDAKYYEVWAEPVPFEAPLTLPTIPTDALPAGLAEYVREVAESFEVHPDLPAACVLGVVAAACQKKFRVHVNGDHYEPTNLYLMPVLPPGERKSGVIPFTLEPLLNFEDYLQERERLNVALAQARYAVEAERRKALHTKAAKGKTDERETAMKELEEMAGKMDTPPALPVLTVGADATPEALATILDQQGGRITIADAEGGRLFSNVGGHYTNGSPNFEILLCGHAGDLLKMHRKGGGTNIVKHPAITTIITVQPDVVRALAGQFKERGLAGRFLYVFPLPMAGSRQFEGAAVQDHVKHAYAATIGSLLELDPAHDADGREVAQILRFSPDAYAVQQEMSRAIDRQMRGGEPLAEMRDWGSKAPGAAGRIAGLLHILEHAAHGRFVRSVPVQSESSQINFLSSSDHSVAVAHTGTERTIPPHATCSCGGRPEKALISADSVLRAWSAITCLKEHARHAYALMASDIGGEFSREILSWVTDRRPIGGDSDDGLEFDAGGRMVAFTKRACHRRFRNLGKELPDALRTLVDRGYFRRSSEKHTAGRPAEWYEVNPLWAR